MDTILNICTTLIQSPGTAIWPGPPIWGLSLIHICTLASALESGKPVASEQLAKPELSLSDVRAVLAKKSQAGFTKEIKALIEKYGAEKLSAVEPMHYEALLKEVEVLKK